ncbi:MAG: Abi-alpha family protein [Methanosarcinaceae archaeon]|nr:Abi-alpha family protein [Methanosarcinaceae archaeon]
MSEIEECAKAASEAAKSGTALIGAAEKCGGFLNKVFGGPIENAVGLLIGDKLVYLRSEKNWGRYIRMIDKIEEDLQKRGCITVRSISPKFTIPLIINASLEEEDNLQDIWCRLIANNLDPDYDFEMRYAFIEIIKNLTFLDAKILKATYDIALKRSTSNRMSINSFFVGEGNGKFETVFDEENMVCCGIDKTLLMNETNCTIEKLDISLDNLCRVRCLRDSSLEHSLDNADVVNDIISTNQNYSLTSLGIAFIKACI